MQLTAFPFRPWVRRAGLSIVLVALVATILIVFALLTRPSARYSWIGEPFVAIYLGTLWLGGLKVFLGTLRPVALVDDDRIIVRPLHHFRERSIGWSAMRGTEQMIGGDRLILFYETPRGQRFVALNLNLVKGRRDFLALIEGQLRDRGFAERIVERSRYLSRPA